MGTGRLARFLRLVPLVVRSNDSLSLVGLSANLPDDALATGEGVVPSRAALRHRHVDRWLGLAGSILALAPVVVLLLFADELLV